MASTAIASSPNAARPLRTLTVPPRRALALPILCTAGLAAVALYGPVRENARLLWSILDSAAVLLAWTVVLFLAARRSGRRFTLELVPRPQHYVQACAHTSIFLYWGWYWAPVYAYAHLILAQLLFAYAFDVLLAWSRRDTYTLGFGPFPIILSTNLFLWFKAEWFFLQFLMIAVGFAAKEFIRWHKDGRQVHIFNPSSFSLTVFSLALLATGTTNITWGQDIAITQFYPPHMYLFLFLVALPGQLLFGVTTMTMSAVVTTYLFGLAYFGLTGTYYFYDSYIPIAVFLGMHLLFTDPSTAPRTDLGRIIFGALYGMSTVVLYELLGSGGPAAVLRQAAAGAAAQPHHPAHRSGGSQRLAAAGSIRQRSAARLLRAGATLPTCRCGRSCSRRSAPPRESATSTAASGFRSGGRPAPRTAPAHAHISHSSTRPSAMRVRPGRALRSAFCSGPAVVIRTPRCSRRLSRSFRSCCGAARDRSPIGGRHFSYGRACAQGWSQFCDAATAPRDKMSVGAP